MVQWLIHQKYHKISKYSSFYVLIYLYDNNNKCCNKIATMRWVAIQLFYGQRKITSANRFTSVRTMMMINTSKPLTSFWYSKFKNTIWSLSSLTQNVQSQSVSLVCDALFNFRFRLWFVMRLRAYSLYTFYIYLLAGSVYYICKQ